MPLYFDTSALSPLFVPDVHTATVKSFFEPRSGRATVSSLTMIELASMVSRSFRARRITEESAREALARAGRWTAQKCDRIEVVPSDYVAGDEYVRRFDLGLRAPDALHVAICRRLGLTLLTCDVTQGQAARELGVETIELSGRSS